jgi:hypothetical protein
MCYADLSMTSRLLAVLGIAVLALLGGLWFKLRQDVAPAATDAPPVVHAPAHVDQGPAHTPPRATTGPSARSRITMPRTPSRPAPVAPTASSGAPSIPAAPIDDATADKMLFHRSLDEQVGLSEPQLVECLEKATKSGAKVDGTTAVSFTIAKGANGKLGVEATGVEYSSIDPGATSCIRDVGKTLTFDALPEGADRVIAYRKVVVKDGKIVENWMTEFAENPGEQPPRQ